MKIKSIVRPVSAESSYSLRFKFDEFTDDEIFLFSKYGFISVDIPWDILAIHDERVTQIKKGTLTLDELMDLEFLFQIQHKARLKEFEQMVLLQVQNKVKEYLQSLQEFAGEIAYKVTATGEIRKINEGAKRALDRNSKEYKEIIEKNREAFEKLSKL